MTSKRLSRLFKKKLSDVNFLETLAMFVKNDTLKGIPFVSTLKKLPELFEQVDIIFNELDAKANLASSNLENSTKELAVANKSLYDLNLTMGAMVESLDEGFIIFDENGVCHEVCSKKCETLFNTNPAGEKIYDVLELKDDAKESFVSWIDHIFSETLSFEDVVELGPTRHVNQKTSRIISLSYKALKTGTGKLRGVVLIGRDITNEIEAIKLAEKTKEHSKMIVKSITDWESFESFFTCFGEFLTELKKWSAKNKSIDDVLRILHTIKGTSSSLSMVDLRDYTHAREEELITLVKSGRTREYDSYVKNLCDNLDKNFKELLNDNKLVFMNYFNKNQKTRKVKESDILKFADLLQSQNYGDEVLDLFLKKFSEVNLKAMFDSLKVKVINACEIHERKVDYSVVGNEDASVAFEPYRVFFGSLIHLINNCIYHGIEKPDEREILGKQPAGQLKISFDVIDEKKLNIKITDDGSGINIAKLKSKVKGLGVNTKGFKDQDYIECIFLDGVSTEDEVNIDAGRGIGMSSLKQNVEDMGGEINVSSEDSVGSTFVISLPFFGGIKYFNTRNETKL